MPRGLVLAIVGVLETLVLAWVFAAFTLLAGAIQPSELGRFLTAPLDALSGEAWPAVWLPAILVSSATLLFLAPLAGPLGLSSHPRSMRSSIVSAVFFAGLLDTAIFVALFELLMFLRGAQGTMPTSAPEWIFWLALAVVLIGSWIVWTILLWRYSERSDHGVARSILRRLFRGTLIELAIVVPSYTYVRSRESCYCGLTTFWALCAGLAGLFFCAGPGAILIWYRRSGAWQSESCPNCGQLRTPGLRGPCPECGHAMESKEPAA